MADLPIHFLATLPRSGSTLCANLLGQNPGLHVTPTSGVIDAMMQFRNTWRDNISFRSQGLDLLRPRILCLLKGMMAGFYEKEFEAGKAVLDKSRGWLAQIELLEEILQRPVKMVVTVRNVEDSVASFEKIYRQSPLTKPNPPKQFFFASQTTAGRADEMLSPGGVVGVAINRFRDALTRKLGNRLVIVPYRQLVHHPVETAALIGAALKLPSHRYDPDNVEQLTQEDDTVHGMDLHKIRQKIEPPKQPAWVDVLPRELAENIAKHYADINKLAAGPVII